MSVRRVDYIFEDATYFFCVDLTSGIHAYNGVEIIKSTVEEYRGVVDEDWDTGEYFLFIDSVPEAQDLLVQRGMAYMGMYDEDVMTMWDD